MVILGVGRPEIALADNFDCAILSDNQCECFTQKELKRIAKAITRLKLCQVELKEKNNLINSRLKKSDGTQPIAWWQEPNWVIGGVAVSFSLGATIAYFLAKK